MLKASDILAEAALAGGWDVKKSEVHGMSQRGGSVCSDVRFGPRILSPMVPPGEAEGWAKYEGQMPFLQTSALTGQNVEEFFKGLGYLALKHTEEARELDRLRQQYFSLPPAEKKS